MNKTLADTRREMMKSFSKYMYKRPIVRDELGSIFIDEVDVKAFLSTAIDQAWEASKEAVKIRRKGHNPHAGHEIDDYYCIQCQEEVKIHPDEVYGFNQAIDELQKRIKDFES